MARVLLILAASLLTAISFGVWRYFSWQTVLEEHRDFLLCEYGYRLQQSRSSGTLRLRFYTCHHQWEYELAGTDLVRAPNARWLSKQQAVYLDLTTHPFHNSLDIQARDQLLYDFESGQLFVVTTLPTSGTDHLAIWPNAVRKTESELQIIMKQLGP